MPEPIARRFTILDAMILVAGLGVGLSLARYAHQNDYRHYSAREYWLEQVNVAMWGLLPVSVFMIAIRLRRPRPSWRRITSQPGFVGSVAVVFALGFVVVLVLGEAIFNKRPNKSYVSIKNLWIADFLPLSVMVSWGTLAIGRRLRAERSWVDRLGRVIGGLWIAGWIYAVIHRIVSGL